MPPTMPAFDGKRILDMADFRSQVRHVARKMIGFSHWPPMSACCLSIYSPTHPRA